MRETNTRLETAPTTGYSDSLLVWFKQTVEGKPSTAQ